MIKANVTTKRAKMGPTPSKKIRRAVFSALSDSPKTIKDIAEEAGTTRITATKHLEVLKKLGKAEEIYRNATLRLFIKIEGKL